jgi:predicted permease
LSNLLQDLRFAFRQMRRSPGFALTAVLTLALGIAANVIVFGVIKTLVLEPLNVPHSDKVWQLGSTNLAFPVFAWPEVRDIRDDNTVFAGVAAEVSENYGMEANGTTRPVWGLAVSGQYFDVLAIRPALGRLLTHADDDHPGASQAVVISYTDWKDQFNGDPNVVGKIVRFNKQPYTVVGVAQEGFNGTEKFIRPSFFVPMQNQASLEGVSWLNQWHDKNVFAIARIKDGVTMPQVQAELALIAARIQRENPKEEEKFGLKLTRPGLIGDFLGGPARAFLAGVMVLAGIVLLAACANLGSLFASRTADRAREISIRMAVGSSRWRVVRQVLVEAIAIAILGGACACVLAWIALTGLAKWHPPTDYPIQFSVTPQPSLMLIALLISVLAGAVFGIMPLRQIFKADPNDAIKSGSSQSGAGRRWALRDVLLAGQIALCCVTVTAAFVALRGMTKTMTMDLGFKPEDAVLTRFDLSQAGYNAVAADQFQRRLLERVSQLPGVAAAGYAASTPLGDNTNSTDVYRRQTTEFKASNKAFSAYVYDVSPGYFNAAETPLLAGRDLSLTDTDKTPLVAVVNQRFAKQLFPGDSSDPVGRYYKNHLGQEIQIVGIVADGKYLALAEDPTETEFFPIAQQPSAAIDLIVRPRAHGISALNETGTAVRKTIRDLDSTIPIVASAPWMSTLALNFFPSQVATAALSLFGAFGLLLSITGTFGLASYTVSKRLRELSIRVALGAQARQILSAALGRMLILLASGSVAGIVLGVAASRLLAAIVYHASAQDPLVLAAVALTMVLTGSLSVAGPVRRALRIDPANLLREQ